jgi:PadR family transcriptional regulator, regulatory protein PadR
MVQSAYIMAIKQREHRIDVLQGTLDMLVLQTLQWGPEHGLGIAQAIRRKSEDLLKIEAGSIYPALHRLEQQRLLAAEWKVSEKGQRAKYYRLTRAGKKQLAAEQSKWERLLKAIHLVMQPTEG